MSILLERTRAALAPTYLVEREIAYGGMGVVFLARDVALGRTVAIKVVRPELATARMIERFTHEARLLANLNHPRIVPIYTAGEADGLFYYVMAYVEGEVLADRLARGKLTGRETVRLGLDILDALASAHRAGVVHRDVNARNVFLVNGRATVADFGIASEVGEDDVAAAGTIGSMPPEQANGGEPSPASDVYAVGSLLYTAVTGMPWRMTVATDHAAWSGVPRRLVRVLRRALQWSPQDRYPDAKAFYDDLKRTTRRRAFVAAPIVLVVALIALLLRARAPADAALQSDLAILPFEVTGTGATSVGRELALLVALSLEGVPGLQLTPVRYSFRWSDEAQEATGAPNYDQLNAKYYVKGTVVQRADILEARINVFEAGDRLLATVSATGRASATAQLGDSIALQLLRRVHPRFAESFGAAAPVSTRSVAALREFLLGEQFFHQGAWLPADRHYRAAVAQDSTFLLAWWRLLNVWRWLPTVVSDPQLDLEGLYRAHGETLSELDRRLIEAQLTPVGPARLAKLEEATRRFPRDGYAALLYGDELFHRGPLSGIPLSRALVVLEQAAALNEYLAPAHEHIAWAAIRLGEQQRARRALDRLATVAAPPHLVDLYTPAFFEQAFSARFDTARATAKLQAFFDPTQPERLNALRLGARAGLLVGLPLAQAALAQLLLQASEATESDRASAHEAMALAAFTLGHGNDGLLHFDSAAHLFRTPESRLEAAEWRVFAGAIGWPLLPAAAISAGRAQLLQGNLPPELAMRAAWALTADQLIRGEAAGARSAISRFRTAYRTPISQQLAQLLDALRAGAAGDFRGAVRMSDALLQFDSHGGPGDPFARALLHIQRSKWHRALGDLAGAESDLIWAENQDLIGWPSGAAQAAEIDWTFTIYALLHRAALTHERGATTDACALLREAAGIMPGMPLPALPATAATTLECAA